MVTRMALVTIVFGLVWSSAFGWGSDGHIYINRIAAQKIPGSMPGFLRTFENYIAYLSPEADRWRQRSELALKDAQEPDHYRRDSALPNDCGNRLLHSLGFDERRSFRRVSWVAARAAASHYCRTVRQLSYRHFH